MNRDLFGMYQGLQGLLDQITPDFEEVQRTEEKTVVVKGMMTKKFSTYRGILDVGNRQYNISLDPSIDRSITVQLRNKAYQNFQKLKYNLIQECERLGYNAKKTDASDVYREGNN